MKHIHADLMLEYAKDASDRDSDDVDWDEPEINIRRIDPYRELREAQERGANVEYLCGGEWVGPTFGNTWGFDNPPDCYRIKPADPYAHLREAQERGALQVCDNPIYIGGLAMLPKIPAWVDRSKDCHMYWNMSPKCYRIKPECNCKVKPKTVKIYLWAYCVDGKWYQTNDYAETMVRGDMSSEVKRIDSTMIEVNA